MDGCLLARVTHRTTPVSLLLSGNHQELISFFVIPSPTSPVVLGLPWLRLHNRHIDWSTSSIVSWSTFCHSHCLRSATPPSKCAAPPLSPDPLDLSGVPSIYHDLQEVFSRDRVQFLPPHRPYDCAFDLLPSAPLPSSKLYNLSKLERESMENYISESLANGLIRPSSSPVGAGFFFVEKKDKFSSAPVLCHPDPAIQFVVDVDASNSGVGAVLSQRSALDNKLHPCSFFSRRLSSAETNYDVGNRELLAVVLALQEWRHWLEGAAHPFFVWTDHRNLAYIQTTRRLNSRQARWALFLGRFRFTSPTVLVPRAARPMLSLASTTPR